MERLFLLQAYNYSIQTLNSTELSKARLRARLSCDPNHRYTYSRDYLGATVAPYEVPEVEKAERYKEPTHSAWSCEGVGKCCSCNNELVFF